MTPRRTQHGGAHPAHENTGDLPRLPHNPVAEQIVLGNCLLATAGEPISSLALFQRLNGKVPASWISNLDSGVAVLGDELQFYRDRILETHAYRQLATAARELMHAYLNGNQDAVRKPKLGLKRFEPRTESAAADEIRSIERTLARLVAEAFAADHELPRAFFRTGLGRRHR
jgi:hypothetical protein